MKIEQWCHPHDQMSRIGRHRWRVARLFELARGLPVMDVPLDHLSLYYIYEKLTLREMVMHMLAVQAADLSRPIILDEDGESCAYCGNEIDLCDDCGERLKHELSVFFPEYRSD